MESEQPRVASVDPDAFARATEHAAAHWWTTSDGRLAPDPEPGVLELRVAASSVARALHLFRDIATAAGDRGMRVAAVSAGRQHRAGVGIGRDFAITPLHIEELRARVPISEIDFEQYLSRSPLLAYREDKLRQRGWVPKADGRLRVVLPRRWDHPQQASRWVSRFSDQTGRPLERKVADVVAQLDMRSRAR